jgi:hypothetical protein
MKKNLQLATLLLLISFQSHSQGFVILQNGEKVKFKKYWINSEQNAIDIKKPLKQSIKISEINYILSYNEVVTYIKEVSNQNSQSEKPYDQEYNVFRKLIEGKISIYWYEVYNNSQYGGYTRIYYFLEKGDVFEPIFESELFENKKEANKNDFVNYFDDEIIKRKLNSDSFKANTKNILDLIREYNLNAFSDNSSPELIEPCNVIFYRGFSFQSKENLVEINIGKKDFTIPGESYKVVKVSNDKPTKICISNEDTAFCDIIRGYSHSVRYYEIISKKSGEIKLELRDKKEYVQYLLSLRK